MFTPLYTPTAITCSKRCSRRVHRWRRKASERNAPGTFTWSEFMRLARRFDYCCAYCGDKPGQLEPDHVIPLSRGGSNSTTNLLPSCHACNTDKSANFLDEWAESRERRSLPPRATNWAPEDRRYWHLTDAMLQRSA
jgi:5-methylcytosine-specific restriction endonuclease McrA